MNKLTVASASQQSNYRTSAEDIQRRVYTFKTDRNIEIMYKIMQRLQDLNTTPTAKILTDTANNIISIEAGFKWLDENAEALHNDYQKRLVEYIESNYSDIINLVPCS